MIEQHLELNIDEFLTPEILVKYGFKDTGKKDLNKPIYRIKPDNYHFELQIVLGSYPETNGNSGVFAIHSPEQDASAVPRDLVRKENWTKEDMERAANYKVKMKEWTQNIAWGVTRLNRLKVLYLSITNTELKQI